MANGTICKECRYCTFLSYNLKGDVRVHCVGLSANDPWEDDHIIEREISTCEYFKLPEWDDSCWDENDCIKPESLRDIRGEICLGSIYLDDYRNSFGIDPLFLSHFCEWYWQWLGEEGLKDNPENFQKFYEEGYTDFITKEQLIQSPV